MCTTKTSAGYACLAMDNINSKFPGVNSVQGKGAMTRHRTKYTAWFPVNIKISIDFIRFPKYVGISIREK